MKRAVIWILWVAAAGSVPAMESISLLDKELSRFEVWVGVPHSSVKGLPEGTYQSSDVNHGTPLGLNVESPKIFTMIEEEGEPVLHVSGEIYAGLTTLQEYENYHLSVWHKWGEKKWPPREKQKRDSGILYHAYGPHGNFWKVWKTSLEYQIQETDLGDFIGLGGNTATPPTGDQVADIRGSGTVTPKRYDPASDQYFKSGGYIHACSEHDAPHGEWNHLELYVIGGTAVHVVNGHVVMVVENAHRPDGKPLTKGQIQIQSEAAECFYKNMTLTPISTFPDQIKKAVRFKNEPPKKEVVLYIYGDVSAKGAVPSGDQPPFHQCGIGCC